MLMSASDVQGGQYSFVYSAPCDARLRRQPLETTAALQPAPASHSRLQLRGSALHCNAHTQYAAADGAAQHLRPQRAHRCGRRTGQHATTRQGDAQHSWPQWRRWGISLPCRASYFLGLSHGTWCCVLSLASEMRVLHRFQGWYS